MRRIIILSAVPVAAFWWLTCIVAYVTALATGTEMSESPTLTLMLGCMAVGCLASLSLRLAGEAAKLPPRPLVFAFCFCGMLCVGVQTIVNWRTTFGDLSGGATSGEPGDRYLNSHGTRIRNLTEQEYHWIEAAQYRQATAFFVSFSTIALGMALHALMVWRTDEAEIAASDVATEGLP